MGGSEQEIYSEILSEMKKISENVISTEYLKSELKYLKSNTDSKVVDLKEDLSELKLEFKESLNDRNQLF